MPVRGPRPVMGLTPLGGVIPAELVFELSPLSAAHALN
jgi:hypothetical protein